MNIKIFTNFHIDSSEHLLRKMDFWPQKTTCPHNLFESLNQTKELLKYHTFSSNFEH